MARGAYVLCGADIPDPELVIIASGSEVAPSVEAAGVLAGEGRRVRVVNMASWERFEVQDKSYQDRVLPPAAHVRLAVEAGCGQGWERWLGALGETHTFDRFGASAPAGELASKFGFDAAGVLARSRKLLEEAPLRAARLREQLQ